MGSQPLTSKPIQSTNPNHQSKPQIQTTNLLHPAGKKEAHTQTADDLAVSAQPLPKWCWILSWRFPAVRFLRFLVVLSWFSGWVGMEPTKSGSLVAGDQKKDGPLWYVSKQNPPASGTRSFLSFVPILVCFAPPMRYFRVTASKTFARRRSTLGTSNPKAPPRSEILWMVAKS